MTSTNSSTGDAPATPRLPYAAPRLQAFGTFAALTRNVGMMGLLRDRTGIGNNKTK